MLTKQTNAATFSSIFDDFFRDWSLTNFSKPNMLPPAVNIKENTECFIVEVAVPGMEKKDFKIDINNDVLIISSEKEEENVPNGDKYTRREYSFHSFKRSFTLPKNVVDEDKIQATYKNGELIINIPKLRELHRITKSIEVR